MSATVTDVWQTHRALAESKGHVTACLGSLRFTHADSSVWSAECDGCALRLGVLRSQVDPAYRTGRLLDAARLPGRFDADLVVHPGISEADRALARFLDGWPAVRPPMLVGANGRGKTHLLVHAARKLIERHEVPVRYCTFSDLLEAAKIAMDTPGASSAQVFDRAATVDLLVLDDLGAGLNQSSRWQMDALEHLVDRRYRGRPATRRTPDRALPVMGATNVMPADWPDTFGARVASRLAELCDPVIVTGKDWRMR